MAEMKTEKDLKNEKRLKRISAIILSAFTAFYIWRLQNNIKTELSFEVYKDKEEKLLELGNRIGLTVDPKVDDNLLIAYYGLTNDKLSDEEKEGFLYIIDLLKDNPYIDVASAAKNIAKIYVNYTYKKDASDTVAGDYRYSTKEIRIYLDGSMSEGVFIHELIHAVFCNNKTLSLPKYIIEGMTEVLTNEYREYHWATELRSYMFDTVMIKVLCEMTNSDTLLKTYTLGEMKYLTDELKEYMNEDEVNKYLKLAKNIFDNIGDRVVSQDEVDELLLLTDKYMDEKYPDDEKVQERYNYYREILEKMSSNNPYAEAAQYIKNHEVLLYPYFSSELKDQYLENQNETDVKKMTLRNYY